MPLSDPYKATFVDPELNQKVFIVGEQVFRGIIIPDGLEFELGGSYITRKMPYLVYHVLISNKIVTATFHGIAEGKAPISGFSMMSHRLAVRAIQELYPEHNLRSNNGMHDLSKFRVHDGSLVDGLLQLINL